ncbi:MAG TPA: phosphotransferase [Anaerolineae bacterium]|jgi:aminoglycoside phosphotransferase (APT) family kinase protein
MNVASIPAQIIDAIGPVLQLSESPQGMTSQVAVAQTSRGTVLLKRAEGILYGGWLANEYRVLSALAAVNMPLAPKPLAFARVDSGIVPERWLAMDYIQGETLEAVLSGEVNADRRTELLRQYGEALARIHATMIPEALPRPVPNWLDYMLDEAGENLEHYSVDGSPQLLAHLRQAHPAPVAQTVIHGDYSIDNVLVDGNNIVGIIDWSGGAVGDPRYDVALGTRPQRVAFASERDSDLAAFYAGYGGIPLSQQITDYYIGLYEFY